jgi:nicotinamide-nucleotide amidase
VTTILAGNGDIQVHLRARCRDAGEAESLLAEVDGPIELLLGDRVYSRNGEPLEEVIGGMLRLQRATLAVAESCTGGMLGERITSVPGSSDYFAGGFITYSGAMKIEMLGVDPEILAQFGEVSREAAEAMAEGARRRAHATYALAITGVAGPDPARGPSGEPVPVGTVYVGLADAYGTQAAHRQYLGDRARIRVFATQLALDLLRRRLQDRQAS